MQHYRSKINRGLCAWGGCRKPRAAAAVGRKGRRSPFCEQHARQIHLRLTPWPKAEEPGFWQSSRRST